MKRKIFALLVMGLLCHAVSAVCAQEKYAVLVLTTGRAGSSALTGVLNILGLDLGDNLLAGNAANPKGNFENLTVQGLNTKIITRLFPQTPPGVPKRIACKRIDWSKVPVETSKGYGELIKEHLRMAFDTTKTFALKDPRITFLLPLYLDAVKRLGYIPKLIIQLREPEEIMESMVKQTRKPELERAFYNCIGRTMMSVVEYIGNTDRIVIYFDDLLHNTEQVVGKLHAFIPGLKTYNEAQSELSAFLDKGLKHHNS